MSPAKDRVKGINYMPASRLGPWAEGEANVLHLREDDGRVRKSMG